MCMYMYNTHVRMSTIFESFSISVLREQHNSLSLYLELGHIVARVTAENRQRILTSSNTYNTGSLHTATLRLEGTRFFLTTRREAVTKRLRLVPVDTLLSHSELLVGRVGLRLQEEQGVDQRNFTGCIRVQSSAAVVGHPEAPKCIGRAAEVAACTYCSTSEVSWPYRQNCI